MYKRIIILGGSGSGKSTLATKIANYTGYPLYHLDELFLESNYEMKDKSLWPKISETFLKHDVGVVDGNYGSNIPLRVAWADLVIFIDTPTWLQVFRIVKRFLNARFRKVSIIGTPHGSKEKIKFNFLIWVLNWNRTRRDKTLKILEEQASGKKVFIINKIDDLDLKTLL